MRTDTYNMDQKLTLKLDEQVIEKAREYAKNRKTSISKLVENYLRHLTAKKKLDEDDISPLVKSFSGVVDAKFVAEPRASYRKHIVKKYSR